MPHYKNGREAKVGDMILSLSQHGSPMTGTVVQISEGALTCNAQIAPPGSTYSVTLSESLRCDDLKEILKACGGAVGADSSPS